MRSHLTLVSVVPPDDIEPGEAEDWTKTAIVYHTERLAQEEAWKTYIPNLIAGLGYGVTQAKRDHPSRWGLDSDG